MRYENREEVMPLGQFAFANYEHSYQVRWNNKDIIVVDMVVVSEPYTPADCVAVPGKNAALERIKMVVSLSEL